MAFHVLFLCMGNICRSPAAEGVFRSLVEQAGLSASITCDSAGTIGYHRGNPPDARMRAAAASRGYALDHRARPLEDDDYFSADLIVAMDDSNRADALDRAPSPAHRARVVAMSAFFHRHEADAVPDPYYGGPDGFDHVMDLIEDGCANLLTHVRSLALRSVSPES